MEGSGFHESAGSSASLKLIHEFLQILPLDKDDVVLLQGFFELRAGHHFIVAMPPGSSIIRMTHRDGLPLRISVTETHDHFCEAGRQGSYLPDIEVCPFAGMNSAVGDSA